MADNEIYELAEIDPSSAKRSIPFFESPENGQDPIYDTTANPVLSHSDILPWSRLRESKTDILRMTIVVLCTMILAWIFADWNTIHLAGWICVLGTGLLAVMAYPLAVGFERPIRMSPERAVRDYFESLEHHGPLYRRMWIFLAPEGQSSRSYADYESFRLYWKQRVREWQHRGNAWPMTPVAITIDRFESKPDPDDRESRSLNSTIPNLLHRPAFPNLPFVHLVAKVVITVISTRPKSALSGEYVSNLNRLQSRNSEKHKIDINQSH